MCLLKLSIKEVIKIHYLFFTGIQVILATGLLWLNRHPLATIIVFNSLTRIQMKMARDR